MQAGSPQQIYDAPADAFVAGTAVYGADDPAAAVRRLRALAQASTEVES